LAISDDGCRDQFHRVGTLGDQEDHKHLRATIKRPGRSTALM
jgi:hypothetical protein